MVRLLAGRTHWEAVGDRRGQDEQGEALERRLRGRLPRRERSLDERQAANARDVEPRGAGEIAEAHAQLAVPNAAVSHETVSQETVSHDTASHETVSHETLRPTFAAYTAARYLFGANPALALPTPKR